MVNFKPLLPAVLMLAGCPNIDTPPQQPPAPSTFSSTDIENAIDGTMRILGRANFRQIPCAALSVGDEGRADEERRKAPQGTTSTVLVGPPPVRTETAAMRYQSRLVEGMMVDGCMEKSSIVEGHLAEEELIFSRTPRNTSTGWIIAIDHIYERQEKPLIGPLISWNWSFVVDNPDNLSRVTLGRACNDPDVKAIYPSVRCSDADADYNQLIERIKKQRME